MPFNLHHLPGPGPRPGPRETIALLAGLMALNAFAIDAMIPALPDIGASLNVAHENDRQLVVVAYFLGFASTQLVWGPLADRFGRKRRSVSDGDGGPSRSAPIASINARSFNA